MSTVLSVSISNSSGLQLELNLWALVLVLVVLLAFVVRKNKSRNHQTYLELTGAEFGTAGVKTTFKANIQDQQVGYMFWVELSTRKIGIPIDENHDVIEEIYNSWYEFFKVSRELIKGIPVNKLQENESTRQLVKVTIHILNNDIRQHLTKWQAKYRRWWESVVSDPKNISLSPQDIQKTYPEYELLIKEMRAVNKNLILYKEKLKKMVVGEKSL